MRDKWVIPVLSATVATTLGTLLYLLIVEVGGEFAKDHLGPIGDFVRWRWATMTTLGVVFFISLLAYTAATKDKFDRTGSKFEADETQAADVIADGVKWVYRGWLEWDDGRREMELDEQCPDHSMPLLNWNPTGKKVEPIHRGYGKIKSKGLYCPGTDESNGHVVTLTASKTLEEARRKAASRLRARLSAKASMPDVGFGPGQSEVEFLP